MTAFDVDAWQEVRGSIVADLPEHPSQLPRSDLAELSVFLRDDGWTYGDIALALAVPKTTVYRWANDPQDGSDQAPDQVSAPGGIGAILGVGLAATFAYVAIRGARHPRKPFINPADYRQRQATGLDPGSTEPRLPTEPEPPP